MKLASYDKLQYFNFPTKFAMKKKKKYFIKYNE